MKNGKFIDIAFLKTAYNTLQISLPLWSVVIICIVVGLLF
jgi:hypothetical protein